MLKVDPQRGETAQSLFHRSLKESDAHVRLRLMGLHLVALGLSGKEAASRLGVHRVSVSEWVHRFNQHGLSGLTSKWRGHKKSTLASDQLKTLKEAVSRHPREVGIKHGR